MNLVVRKPGFRTVRNHNSVDHFIDNFFNRSLGDFFGNDFVSSTPSVNVKEYDNRFELALAAPGLNKGDFDVKVENDHLTISAKHESKNEETKEDGTFVRREFSYGSFERNFRLSENVNSEAISANYENGVLVVTLPKAEPVDTSRVIEIH